MARIVFMGTPLFAAPSLEILASSRHEVAAVFTRPPQPSGRGMRMHPSPIHKRASELGFDVETPRADEMPERLAAYRPDFLIVVAYGLILRQDVLDIPTQAAINGHASLLPRWRGAAPIQRAILAGDEETGATAMLMEERLDSGAILGRKHTDIEKDDTAGSLHDRLAVLTARVLIEAVDNFATLTPKPQNENAVTWAHKITPAEAEIDFSRPATDIERHIRAFHPRPGAWFIGHENQRIKVLAATLARGTGPHGGPHEGQHTGQVGAVLGRGASGAPLIATADGALELTRIQPEGKPEMDGAAFLNGYRLPGHIRKSGGR